MKKPSEPDDYYYRGMGPLFDDPEDQNPNDTSTGTGELTASSQPAGYRLTAREENRRNHRIGHMED